MSLARGFYDAFARLDGDAMAACYADDVRFSDPVFPGLQGNDAKAMWRMLCRSARDLKVTYRVIREDAHGAEVDWEAHYLFSKTGRRVHNVINAQMQFQNGKIFTHCDHFSFWRWSRQALGPVGLVLGWTPLVRGKVRAQAAQSLAAFSRSK